LNSGNGNNRYACYGDSANLSGSRITKDFNHCVSFSDYIAEDSCGL
jgi:hypothetical protein